MALEPCNSTRQSLYQQVLFKNLICKLEENHDETDDNGQLILASQIKFIFLILSLILHKPTSISV